MPTYGFSKNKCKREVYTKEEVDKKVANAEGVVDLSNYYTKEEVDAKTAGNYSRGTSAPTGGVDGDIYDQFFE